jgi:uncharacterized Zn-binding protein involved in type VI secretion
MPPGARIGHMHVRPMATPGTPPIPHVGGPVRSGYPTVSMGFVPAARVTDTAVCAGQPDSIAKGLSSHLSTRPERRRVAAPSPERAPSPWA